MAAALVVLCLNAAAGEPPVAPQPQLYRFAGGERIKLIVPKEVGEPIEQLVSEDGWVSLPTGGTSVNIKGKTIPESQTLIGEMLEKQSGAKRVFAAIALLEVPARKVFVGGEVKLPQALVVPPGTSLSLAAALASAGGATTDADLTRVALTQSALGAAPKTITFDASKLGQPENIDLGPTLEPGAVVTVPRGEVYFLAGEVFKPGTYNRRELSLGPNESATLTRVLFSGGGLKPTGSRKDIRLIRTIKDGSREVVSVNLDDVLRALEKEPRKAAPRAKANENGDEQTADPALKNGDTILVGSAGGVAILGKVKLPGLYPLAGDSLKLTRLIAMAGGFADFAKTSSVIVIRAATPKTPLRVDMNNITRDGDLEKDIDLEEGDLVFVGEKML
jgi:polysaccharide biosynthesis/export protein